jgi:hypothetical protein
MLVTYDNHGAHIVCALFGVAKEDVYERHSEKPQTAGVEESNQIVASAPERDPRGIVHLAIDRLGCEGHRLVLIT